MKKFNIVANQAIALGVYKRDNVLKAKFAKALCYNDITLKASLLSSAMVDSQSYGDFCTHAVILYNTATANRSVSDTQTDAKKAGGKDIALVARFNNIRGRMAGRGRGRHEYSGRGSNYRGLFNSRNRHDTSNRQNHGKDHFNSTRGREGGRNVRSTSSSLLHPCTMHSNHFIPQ